MIVYSLIKMLESFGWNKSMGTITMQIQTVIVSSKNNMVFNIGIYTVCLNMFNMFMDIYKCI